MADKEPEPGLYRHYKGGFYEVFLVAEHHETREKFVVYRSVSHNSLNIRPLEGSEKDPDGWNAPGPEGVQRFSKTSHQKEFSEDDTYDPR